MTPTTPEIAPEPAPRPFAVPCRKLGFDAPLRWLRLGWGDFRRAPRLSLLFGTVIVLVSVAVSALAWWLGRFALLATLLSGFVFVAPMLAVGLYCVSRSLEHGESPSLRCSFALARRVAGQAGVYALAQGVVILLWSRAGMMLSALWPVHQGDIADGPTLPDILLDLRQLLLCHAGIGLVVQRRGHLAVSQVAEDGFPSGSVVQTFQKGYLLNDRLLRPAMVVVAP